MNKERRLDLIIDKHLPAIIKGQETLDSVLRTYPKEADSLGPRLEAVAWLVDARKDLDPRPGYIPASREYLEQKIATTPPHNAWQRLLARYSPPRWAFNLAAPLVLLLIIALMVNSLVLAARLSIPGDPFYSAKIVIEDIQLAITFDQVDKSNLYIEFSRERTTEFVQLVLEGEYERLPAAATHMETEIIATLHYMNATSQMDPLVEIPMISALRDTLTNEITMLRVLRDTSPSYAHAEIDLAIHVTQAGVMALR